MQVVGVGSQEDFEGVQEFVNRTDLPTVPILWEQTGNFWRLNSVRTNSAMQLYSYDLSQQSGIFFFNDNGRAVVLDAAIQVPWSPVDRTASS